MQKTAKLMFSLIAATIENKKTFEHCFDEAKAKKLFALSSKQDMAHIVSAGIDKFLLLPQESEVKKAFLKQKLIAVYRREQLNSEEEKICRLLEESLIDHIPLKGAVIRRFYPEEWMRTSCDIDILVKEQDLEKAIELIVQKLNYSDCGRDFHDHHLKAPNGVHLELHFSIAEKDNLLDPILNRVWDFAVCEDSGKHRYSLCNEFLIFQAVAHTKFHFITGGCGIRPLTDLWILEKKLAFSRVKLEKLLTESNCDRFYAALKQLISVWFEGGSHNSLTLKMEEYILAGGVFGTKANVAAAGKYKSGGKAKYIFSRIFMPKSDLEVAFPRLKKYPFLLPYYEIKRWFSLLNKKSVSNAKSEMKSNGDVSEMLKELGF